MLINACIPAKLDVYQGRSSQSNPSHSGGAVQIGDRQPRFHLRAVRNPRLVLAPKKWNPHAIFTFEIHSPQKRFLFIFLLEISLMPNHVHSSIPKTKTWHEGNFKRKESIYRLYRAFWTFFLWERFVLNLYLRFVLNGWELNLYHVPRNGLAKIVSAVSVPIYSLIRSGGAMQTVLIIQIYPLDCLQQVWLNANRDHWAQ